MDLKVILQAKPIEEKLHHFFAVLFLALFPAAFVYNSVLPAQAFPATEYQIKAVFLFNFAQFIEWPSHVFGDANSPLVIGILGDDPFGPYLEEAIRGEKVNNRPLIIEHYSEVQEIKICHILFVSRSKEGQLEQILLTLKGLNILTVGDFDGFAKRGGMIRFVKEKNKIRFRINLGAVTAANLTISSKLLRPAQIIAPGKD